MRETSNNIYGIKEIKEINVGFWWRYVKRKNNLKKLDTDGRIILTRIIKEIGQVRLLGLSGSGYG
jgi:hypothetical protein